MFFVVLAFESMEMLNIFLLTRELDAVSEKKLILADSDIEVDAEEFNGLFSKGSKYCLLCPMSLKDAKLIGLEAKGDAS